MLQLKNKLVDEHIQLIQQLETRYSGHISTLLQQKAYIHKQIQLSFYEKLFDLMQPMMHQNTVTNTDATHSDNDPTNDDVTNTTSSIQLNEEASISRISCCYSDHEPSQHMNIHRNNSLIPFVANQQSEETESISMNIDNNDIESQTTVMKTKKEAESFKNAGNALLKRRKYQQALDEYNKAIDVDSTNSVYYCNRAAAYHQLQNYKETIIDSRKAWCIDPNYIKAYIREGMAQYKMKYYQKAFVAYSKAHNKIVCGDTNHKMNQEIETKLKLCKMAMMKPNMNDIKWCCDYCNKIFMNQASLYRHCESHDECATYIVLHKYECKYCPYISKNRGHLQKHEGVHERGTRYAFKCDCCSYSSHQETLLIRHRLLHNKNEVNVSGTINETFQCIYCPKTCTQQLHLNNHIMNKHTRNYLKPNKCRFCVYAAATKGAIRIHEILMHNNRGTEIQRAFKCDICDNTFVRKQHLAHHSKIHDASKPFLCTLCYKQFTEKQHLQKHIWKMHKHTNIRTIKKNITEENDKVTKGFECCHCESVCDTWDNLEIHKLHMMKHTGNNVDIDGMNAEDITRTKSTFECSVCQKAFKEKRYLTVHFRIHTGEKPYKCDECGERFRTYGMHDVHLKKHFEGYPYKCDVCKMRFEKKNELKKHYPYCALKNC